MTISFNKREKEILIDVLEAHLETLDVLIIDDGHEEFKEERDAVDALLDKVQEA